jgi:hypothetical protein
VWAGGEQDFDAVSIDFSAVMDAFFADRPEMRPEPPPPPKCLCRQATVIDQRMKAHIFDPKRKEELADALVELQERNGGVHHYTTQLPPLALPSGASDA